jgi:hypothetical protein
MFSFVSRPLVSERPANEQEWDHANGERESGALARARTPRFASYVLRAMAERFIDIHVDRTKHVLYAARIDIFVHV